MSNSKQMPCCKCGRRFLVAIEAIRYTCWECATKGERKGSLRALAKDHPSLSRLATLDDPDFQRRHAQRELDFQ